MDRNLAPPGIAHHYQRLAELSTLPSPARPVCAGPLGRDQGTAVSDPGPAVPGIAPPQRPSIRPGHVMNGGHDDVS